MTIRCRSESRRLPSSPWVELEGCLDHELAICKRRLLCDLHREELLVQCKHDAWIGKVNFAIFGASCLQLEGGFEACVGC